MEKQTIFSEMWSAYRGIIMHSIVTSFGLDFLVKDQTGGDVDTIHNVRESGIYKNAHNAAAYENRGEYDSVAYHHNDAYDNMIREARGSMTFIDDAYVPDNKIYYGKASNLRTTGKKANLDHVISAKEVHEDRGRVLAGLDGVELANQETNLRFTNESLNKSMGAKTIEEYIQWRTDQGDPLPDDVQKKMREEDANARQAYEQRINNAYYSSDKFILDAGIAATQRGLEMGVRQALGFLFIEIWCACEDEIKALPSGINFEDCVRAIAHGIQKGFDNTRSKYKNLFSQFTQGFMAGSVASLTTTLINIFITTDKNTIRYIRQVYITVVQVGNILLINPDDLLLGNQLKAATVAVATGASVLTGTAVGNLIAGTPIGADKKIGRIVQNFCASLVSGLMSCTLLIMIDRSKFIGQVVEKMNSYGSIDHELRETTEVFVKIAAEVAQCDVIEFADDVDRLHSFSNRMLVADDNELNSILLETFDTFSIPLPWSGDFDAFMSDSENRLVFD